MNGYEYCVSHLRQRALTPAELAQSAAVASTLALLEPELLLQFPVGQVRRYLALFADAALASPRMAEFLAAPAQLPADEAQRTAAVWALWIGARFRSKGTGLATGESAPASSFAALIHEMPHILPQLTCEEVRILAEGLAHGQRGTFWHTEPAPTITELGSSLAYSPPVHSTPWVFTPRRDGHIVTVDPSALAGTFENTIATWDLDSSFLALIIIGTLSEGVSQYCGPVARGYVAPVADLSTDDILAALGKDIRGADQRNTLRCWVRDQLRSISQAVVSGARKGHYTVPGSQKATPTYQHDALFILSDSETTWDDSGARGPNGCRVPIRVRIHGGGLFREMAKNPHMTQQIGNLRTLTAIPGGQPSGQWARSMGLSFAQFIRENLHKSPTRQRTSISRRELLYRFPPTPAPDHYLKSKTNTDRALTYWTEAKLKLHRWGWWDKFPEPELRRQGVRADHWGEVWLNQEVTPTPGSRLLQPELDLR